MRYTTLLQLAKLFSSTAATFDRIFQFHRAHNESRKLIVMAPRLEGYIPTLTTAVARHAINRFRADAKSISPRVLPNLAIILYRYSINTGTWLCYYY